MIVAHHPITCRERLELVVPHTAIAESAVDENHTRPVAGFFDIELPSVTSITMVRALTASGVVARRGSLHPAITARISK
jgi:hypothetical protein